jgi:hypothetical protein
VILFGNTAVLEENTQKVETIIGKLKNKSDFNIFQSSVFNLSSIIFIASLVHQVQTADFDLGFRDGIKNV